MEAYCRGLTNQLEKPVGQVEALEKLVKVTDTLKDKRDDTAKVKIFFLFSLVLVTLKSAIIFFSLK